MNPLQGIISENMLEASNAVMKELLSIEVNDLRETYNSGTTDYTSSTSGSSRFYNDTVLNSEFVADADGVKVDFYITQGELDEVLFVGYTNVKGTSTLFVASNQSQVPVRLSVEVLPVMKELDEVIHSFYKKKTVII